jgi:hypothetical protein
MGQEILEFLLEFIFYLYSEINGNKSREFKEGYICLVATKTHVIKQINRSRATPNPLD